MVVLNLWDRYRECQSEGLPGIPREELLGYMEEVAVALDRMNIQDHVQHLDVKPQNLVLIDHHVKVAVNDLTTPETFDAKVTRFCDQYSLAVVYQEVRTGKRPFNGRSLQQLIMQHLSSPPDVSPLPSSERPVVARALSKRPEARFPSCGEFVRALHLANPA